MISIFVLLLISVVAIALVVSSGTETAIASNYRSATGVYYASLAGLEEGRGRLQLKNPKSFVKTAGANFLPPPGTQFDIGYVSYVLNPAPTDGNVLATYPDTEYNNEFGNGKLEAATAAGTVATTASVWNIAPLNALPVPGPLYKWVRINAVSEVSQQLQVAPIDGHVPDPTKPIYYDGTSLTIAPTGAQQVLEITSLAVLPNGSQKILQYLAAPVPITLPPLLAALTLSGSAASPGAVFGPPDKNNVFYVSGNNQECNGSSVLGSAVPAIGVLNGPDGNPVINAIKLTSTSAKYTGSGATTPDVEDISGLFPVNLQSPSQLDALAQSIVPYADVVITPKSTTNPPYTATGADLTPLGMNSGNLLTVVVNGNLDVSNWSNDGYGLLLVTGTFTYDPDTNWYGIILVIGQGVVNNLQNGQFKQLNGAVLVAKTRDSSGKLLPEPPAGGLGAASVKFDDKMQGNGIRYSSCWIQKAQPTSSYRILSFHEISQ